MSNGTPTEQQGQSLNNFGEYDNNVDIQPEALPEPVEYSPQEAFSQPDMIPISDRRSQEEKPLISGMAPIEPDVVQGLQYEQEPFDTAAKTSTLHFSFINFLLFKALFLTTGSSHTFLHRRINRF
jgi:hypothetical protein